ncbi:hypothetical protein BMS3Bbin06_00300 [bacterium BMS3Bbin06]|nr:hypothetical protein BMS3Bbin06_00300 [bacterium BMS3Bbin06]
MTCNDVTGKVCEKDGPEPEVAGGESRSAGKEIILKYEAEHKEYAGKEYLYKNGRCAFFVLFFVGAIYFLYLQPGLYLPDQFQCISFKIPVCSVDVKCGSGKIQCCPYTLHPVQGVLYLCGA